LCPAEKQKTPRTSRAVCASSSAASLSSALRWTPAVIIGGKIRIYLIQAPCQHPQQGNMFSKISAFLLKLAA